MKGNIIVQNFKKIEYAELQFDSKVIKITGKNAQGKSSLLDAFRVAIGGKKAIPQNPIKNGAKTGTIALDIDTDDYGVVHTEWTFTKANSKVGYTATVSSSSQAFLADIIGKMAIDPLAFSKMDDDERVATLASLAQVDVKAFKKERSAIYEERKLIGREKLKYSKELDVIVEDAGGVITNDDYKLLNNPVNVTSLMEELSTHNAEKAKVEKLNAQLQGIKDEAIGIGKQILDLEAQIKELEVKREALLDRAVKGEEYLKNIPSSDSIQLLIDAAESAIKNASKTGDRVALVTRYQKAVERVDEAALAYDEKTALLNKMDKDFGTKVRGFADNSPVKGLTLEYKEDAGMDNGEFFVYRETPNGVIPYSELSSSEQLKIGTNIALALNPNFKMVIIKDGSLIDEDGQKMLQEVALKNDASIFLEIVGEQKGEIIIRDGAILEEEKTTKTKTEKTSKKEK